MPRADLKVIGAGCGRTGTASFKRALEILGFNAYHMSEMTADATPLWTAALTEVGERAVVSFISSSFIK